MSLGSEKIPISGNFPFLKTKGRTHVSFYLKCTVIVNIGGASEFSVTLSIN